MLCEAVEGRRGRCDGRSRLWRPSCRGRRDRRAWEGGCSRPRRLPHARLLRRRPRRRVRAARARSLVRGAPRGRRRHPGNGSRDPRGREAGLTDAVERHREWMLAHGTTTFEAKSGYGLDRETELAQLRAIGRAGGVPTYLGAHAVPPEFPDGDAYLDFVLARRAAGRGRARRSADVFLERGSVRRRASAPLPHGMSRGRARASAARRPVHRGGRHPARRRARRAERRPPGGDRARRRASPGGNRRRSGAPARRGSDSGPADASGSSSRRRRGDRRPRDGLQPRAAPSARAFRL